MCKQLGTLVLALALGGCYAPEVWVGPTEAPPRDAALAGEVRAGDPWHAAAALEVEYRYMLEDAARYDQKVWTGQFRPTTKNLRFVWKLLGVGRQFLERHAWSEAGHYLWEATRAVDSAYASPLQRLVVRQEAATSLAQIAAARNQPLFQALLTLDAGSLAAYANTSAVRRFHEKFHANLDALRDQHETAAAAQAAAENAEMFRAIAVGAAIGLQNAGSKDPMAGVRMEQQKQQYVQQATANMERVQAQTAKAHGEIVNALNELKMLSASDLVEVQAGRPFIGAEIGYILAQPDCDTRCIQPVEAFAATRPRVKAAVAAFKQAEGEAVKPALKELAESIQEVEVWAAKNERMGKVAAGVVP